jgi:HEPN domain-containing protein
MRVDVRLWQEDARYDFDCAQDMLEHERFNYAVWLSRQAAEKMLKAAYMQVAGRALPVAHNLVALAQDVAGKIPAEISSNLSFLNPHYTVTRYVDAAVGKPSDMFDREFAEEAYRRAGEVLEWIESNYLTTSENS